MKFINFPEDFELDKNLKTKLEERESKIGDELLVSFVGNSMDEREGIVLCIAYEREGSVGIDYMVYDKRFPNSYSGRFAGNVQTKEQARELMNAVVGAKTTRELEKLEFKMGQKINGRRS